MKTAQTKQNSKIAAYHVSQCVSIFNRETEGTQYPLVRRAGNCQKTGSAYEVCVRFGEGFGQEMTCRFAEKALREPDDDFAAFCEEIQKTCKETLIADYFKMVKP